MGELFGTDGIRGVANRYPMDGPTAMAVGRAVGMHFGNPGVGTPVSVKPLVVIGQDTRLSGDMLVQALAAGVCAAGADVGLVGVLPTPGIARIAVVNGAVAGIVVSASHNPFADNGIKLFDGNGFKLNDVTEKQIEERLRNNHRDGGIAADGIGRLRPVPDPMHGYLEFLLQAARGTSLDGMTLVLDCANGATFRVAPELFRRLGARVVPMFHAPNGININDQCGSQHPEPLAEQVVARGADLGLAFDGDGDRLIAVDETGQVLTGDRVLAVCALDMQQKGLLENNRVVTTVMSNTGLHQALQRLGIDVKTTQVGDRYVMQTMLEQGAVMGGEDSGHMIFRDLHTTGDGLIAALRLLAAMRSAGRPLSEMARIMTVFPQTLINVAVNNKPDLTGVPEIAVAISKAEAALADHGRVLVRYSGTQNMCRVMVEGPTRDVCDRLCRDIAGVVARAIK